MTQLLVLPPEIWALIIEHYFNKRDSLPRHRLRRVNKVFNDLISEHVFHVKKLKYTTVDSLKALDKAIASPRVLQYVKAYHCSIDSISVDDNAWREHTRITAPDRVFDSHVTYLTRCPMLQTLLFEHSHLEHAQYYTNEAEAIHVLKAFFEISARKARGKSSTPIRNLHFEDLQFAWGAHLVNDVGRACEGMTCVTKIDWTFEDNMQKPFPNHNDFYAQVIRGANSLESFRLLHCVLDQARFFVATQRIFDNLIALSHRDAELATVHTWPNLKSVHVRNIKTGYDIFLAFLTQHKTSLQSITMKRVWLLSSYLGVGNLVTGWRELFLEFHQNQSGLPIQGVKLSMLTYSDGDMEKHKHIGKTEQNMWSRYLMGRGAVPSSSSLSEETEMPPRWCIKCR